MTKLLHDERPVARKDHRCNACLGTIAAGDRYIRQRCADGGDAWTWRCHRLCDAVWWWLADGEFAEDYVADVGEVREALTGFFARILDLLRDQNRA